MRSKEIKDNLERAPHRALLKAVGLNDDDFKKPFIAIANSYTTIVPGHIHLDKLAKEVAIGVTKAGGVPFEFNTIAVCDGLAMNHEGMKYSLPSREIIADSIEIMIQAHRFDGMVLLSNCDKITPGMLMAAARVDIPTIVVTGGPMLSGYFRGKKLGVVSMFEAVGEFKAGKINYEDLKEMEERACPTPGSCNGMFTANTMACVTEALGLSMTGSATIPAVDSRRIRIARLSGEQIVNITKNQLKPKEILVKEAFENAITVDMALGGSTNTVLHLSAIAQELDLELDLDVFDVISEKTPHICDMNPGGEYTMEDLDRAGGIPAVMAELKYLINSDVITVTGKTMGKNIEYAKILDKNVIRPISNPIHKEGGIVILRGNIAPKGAVIKTAAIKEDFEIFRGPAIVFDSEVDAMKAILNNQISKGDVIAIRYEGPKGGPGMKEMLAPTSIITGLGLGEYVALITDGRFSGGTKGICIGHISPEAAEGGPIAILKDNDIVEINLKEKSINVKLTSKEIKKRLKDLQPFIPKVKKGYLVRYSSMVSSADKGAVTKL